MKWAVLGLTFLGVIAAACAALLVNAVRAQGTRPLANGIGSGEVQVLLAASPMREMTVVESSAVITKTLPRSQAPERFISDPVQVVGRILVAPMVEGQVFTPGCFATEEKIAHLAALLPKGKRAVGISVSDYGGLMGVLYPGCAVDVMVSVKGNSNGKEGSTSKLLLQNIPVWGIEDQTIVSALGNANALPEGGRPSNTRRVTLLVDTKQAKSLEVGMQEGSLSLALRNPLDNSMEASDIEIQQQAMATNPTAAAPIAPDKIKAEPQWEMKIIRGSESEMKSFPASDADSKRSADPAAHGAELPVAKQD